MPFTLSHAAAVLPGIRRDGTARGPLFASALVLGSLAPDMTYFAASALPGAMGFGTVTHGPLGVLTVDVVITAALLALWLLMRDPLVALLPAAWRGRAYGLLRGRSAADRPPLATALWFYVSAVIGASTHVVWDAFTHFDRWGVRMAPVLGETVAGFPVYSYAQYGSSAVALVALVWFVATALRRVPAMPAPPVPLLGRGARLLAAGLVAVCVMAGIVHRCLRYYQYWGRIKTPLDIIPTACFGAGAGLAAGLVLYATAVRLRERSRPPADADVRHAADLDRTGV
ncbi:DUF4184 family protein [Streptomyces xantholiticus]|uniref:DUF4184 family protein n=1 Tax=Streptomyces xantholiticus TaxID=68285 RepID=UPI0016742A4E|nr:DUF4184 family protein [Streptomyces xantholiticus]GGW32739.1 hypothetical protein GCM10010381_16920 [Streptomyces xantholiticus]